MTAAVATSDEGQSGTVFWRLGGSKGVGDFFIFPKSKSKGGEDKRKSAVLRINLFRIKCAPGWNWAYDPALLGPAIHYQIDLTGTPEQVRPSGLPDSVWQQ
ncbi:hypothetical protein M8J77_010071 [Diaphorina citri]|nr:hypothetical protein M8J77_010071 [Diaphorina citri]